MQEKLPAQTSTYHYFTEAQSSYGKYSGRTAELFSLVLYPVVYASEYFLLLCTAVIDHVSALALALAHELLVPC